uniref:Predicted protein n=1 Tax=Hordeum vulgare subsp. vulgare TaxID=112509 RepID=F2CSL8_HORVV|nr:predicted protein [Hordeum vulgare subsp. vulgare]
MKHLLLLLRVKNRGNTSVKFCCLVNLLSVNRLRFMRLAACNSYQFRMKSVRAVRNPQARARPPLSPSLVIRRRSVNNYASLSFFLINQSIGS